MSMPSPDVRPPPPPQQDIPLASEHWFKGHWRPAMAWLYMVICAADFLLFPVLNAAAAGAGLIPYHEWHPMTLQNGGSFHVAMGAILFGITMFPGGGGGWRGSGYGGYDSYYRQPTTTVITTTPTPKPSSSEPDGSRVRGGD